VPIAGDHARVEQTHRNCCGRPHDRRVGTERVMNGVARPLQVGSMNLPGEFDPAAGACGVVVIANGPGSPSPRSLALTNVFHGYRLSTLRIDLVAIGEASATTVDVAPLSVRMVEAIHALDRLALLERCRVGVFGNGVAAAAAVRAAAEHPASVAAVVCICGRLDLVREFVPRLRAPTLLICAGCDPEVLAINRAALKQLRGRKRLETVPGASDSFDEPGAADSLAQLAGAWMSTWLPAAA
jgi:putative phosphoribosyl transferase